MMDFKIRRLHKNDQQEISKLVREHWGGNPIIVHGDSFQTDTLEGLMALSESKTFGFLHYQIRDEECEILTLLSLQEHQGVGTALIDSLEQIASEHNCRKLSLITTNDNLHALGFYQRRGFHLAALYPNQVEVSRRLKPAIPEMGNNGIPIRDEIKLEKALD